MEGLGLEEYEQYYSYFFYGGFATLSLLEAFFYYYKTSDLWVRRWVGNISLLLTSYLVAWFIVPISELALALYTHQQEWGLFSQISLPLPITLLFTIFLIDATHYLKHRLFHSVPLFWRFHLVHHTDSAMDFTTGLRFHPFENLINAALVCGLIVAFGLPAGGIFCYQILSIVIGLTSHANIRIPEKIDDFLRFLIVTPKMHWIHHSDHQPETNSNYGVIFSIWDRLWGSYTARPRTGYENITMGLHQYTDKKYLTLPWMLVQPFLNVRK